jgi:hypothetical protein
MFPLVNEAMEGNVTEIIMIFCNFETTSSAVKDVPRKENVLSDGQTRLY